MKGRRGVVFRSLDASRRRL
ncbi:hypothetical protein [Streptomyces sp. NPDC003393]